MNLLIVESPAKAKTINKYLGKDFTVLASYGHVRDLEAKDGSVKPDDGFSMEWQVEAKGEKRLQDIISAAKGTDTIYLATDPDREGEAISWHIAQELERRKKLAKGQKLRRITFNQITKSAVLAAVAAPRDIDQNLVDAYLARRALDYLVGFGISPILWRKLPGSRSAGRVQSVALRLICEREAEIMAFKPQEYWTIEGAFGQGFSARLTQADGVKIEKFTVANQAQAEAHKANLLARADTFAVQAIDNKQVSRHPAPPFTTSTLQQEAARKLYFSAKRTMQLAQNLYEEGLITYMRTDSVNLAQEAVDALREMIGSQYGAKYRPEKPNYYKTKAKNAQEAHEAVRPADPTLTPANAAAKLDKDQLKLYDLIWKRAVASQMASALFDQVGADIASGDKRFVLRATGQTMVFDGFIKIYREGMDEDSGEASESRLPKLAAGQALNLTDVAADQHFTEPPPRYSEASLVKKMEELGIGRPSTYASIISVLQDRNYVRLENRKFTPESRGKIVVAFLEFFFSRYVQYDFTANLEERLDDIADGAAKYLKVLEDFWKDFKDNLTEAGKLRLAEVIDKLDLHFARDFYGEEENRACPKCGKGSLHLRLGKYGAFLGCSNYPDCDFVKDLDKVVPEGAEGSGAAFPRQLGTDADGEKISVGVSRFGPYVKKGSEYRSVPKGTDAAAITLEQALELLAQPKKQSFEPVELGKDKGETITLQKGRFGLYLKKGKLMASLPKSLRDEERQPTLEEAVAILNAKAGSGSGASTPNKRQRRTKK
ncbi:DNA topoisomerase 1 [Alphaproteobacteria bacterium]|nr:DNA topoisomerase 1 [Alphaproteobacteria bacterium]